MKLLRCMWYSIKASGQAFRLTFRDLWLIKESWRKARTVMYVRVFWRKEERCRLRYRGPGR